MSSPIIRKQSTSPIRNLDDKSPKRNTRLHTIVEQQPYLTKNYGFRPDVLTRQNTNLNVENRVLNDKVRNYAEQTSRFIVENSRLRQQNDVLKDWGYTANVISLQKLNRQILLKDAEIEKLAGDMALIKAQYQRNLDHFRLQNEGLRNQLIAIQNRRYAETQQIKNKYTAIAQQDMTLARKGYYEDVNRLMSNLQATKALLIQKQQQIKQLTNHGQILVKQHSIYLQQLVSQNNILRNKILQIQIKRDNQVKQAQSKRQLQKSRTHGIMTYCKQNTAFIQKQISKLAEQLLEKSISIEQFTKDMLKIKRNLQQTQKRYQDKIYKLQKDCDDKLQQQWADMDKAEKYHKFQLADLKKIQLQLRQTIATKDHQYQTLQRQNQHNRESIHSKQRQIQQLKANLTKIHEDHAKQISKVMTDSRVKRKSMRNLSQSSSLRDFSADGNSQIIKKPSHTTNILVQGPLGSSGQLYTVPQQLAASQLVPNEQQQEDIAMKDLVLHYQNIIQQLKNNKALELSLAHENIQKLNQSLREKQQEVLQILQRFSPLMQYKINPSSLQEERKKKIQHHYKANIDLLSVMLDKYSISALSKKK